MAAERDSPTATDYIVTALSPVLIMLMVGSLVFFLVEVLYAGQYSGKLLYTLFFFVLGAVLVARIAIETDAARASMYGLLLGIVTYIAILSYVDYPGGGWLARFGWLVNLGLMLLIWWSAHKLTWDCTHIDEKRKGAGRGLLSAAGLDADSREQTEAKKPEIEKKPEPPAKKKKGKSKKQPDSRLWNWIDKYQQHREVKRKAPHTPGVWVIYFALAALPLFALGQSLVGPEDDARRRATFLQMAVYIASALGLLVTTSLLGLRRYLRQRKAKIPTALAGGWLGLGAVMIFAFLVIGAFLPRPHSEVPWFGIERAGKAERNASKYAMSKSGSGKGDGAGGEKTTAGDGKASGKGGKAGGGSKGEKGSGKGNSGKGGSGKKGDQSGGNEKGGGKGDGNEDDPRKDQEGEKDREGNSGDENEENKEQTEGNERSSNRQSSTQLGATLEKIVSGLKWIVFAIVAILVIVVVVLAILRYLAPFTEWAQRLLDALRNFCAGLWGKKASVARKSAGDEASLTGPDRPPPFHEFSNPFTDGSADERDPAELVAYTFDALDSWAWDRDRGRELPETPLEFIARLADSHPDLVEPFTGFVKVYARVTYSKAKPPKNTLAALEAMWEAMVHGVAVALGEPGPQGRR